MTTTSTIERAHDLRNAIVDMTLRYGNSSMSLGAAFATGTYDGKSVMYWRNARRRQFRALQRLSRALRNLATEG